MFNLLKTFPLKTKILTLITLAFFVFNTSKAQSLVEVTGQIKDADSKKALEFCTIAALNKKDSLISGTVSDQSGYFTLQVPKGVYKFKISFIGYTADTTKSILVGSDKFLGVFKLKPDVKILSEFSVKTSSQENLIDRDVQIVTEKMKAGTSSTKEVLDKMDGVEYDRYSKAIKVDNSDKVIILVDGVEKDQEYVKNLTPERLKKIEVIRDPSGKYALEGYTAVINVILKNDYQGTEILISNENLFDIDAKKTKNIFLTNGTSATLNYTYNKINIYSKFRNNLNNFSFATITERKFEDSNLVINMKPLNENGLENKYRESYNNLIYGVDYNINPKNSFSFEGNYTYQPRNYNINHSIDKMQIIKNNILKEETINNQKTETESRSQYFSLFYNGKINEKHSFKANTTYSIYSDNAKILLFDKNNVQGNEEVTENFKNKVKSYIEYYYTINDKHNIQIGYGNSYEELQNRFGKETKMEDGTTLTDFRNKIYSYYGFQPNKKFGIKVGIAAENTKPELKIATKKTERGYYNIFLPYADVKYKINQTLDFKLKYRASSNYPSIDQVSSASSLIERNTIRVGNPMLKADITHKLSFQINVMGGFARVEPYFNYSDNMISQSFELQRDTVLFSYNNIDKYTESGVMVNFTVPFGKSLFWQNDFRIYSPRLEYKGNVNKFTDFTMNSQLVYVNEPNDLVAGFKYQKGMFKFPMAQGYNKWNVDFWLLFAQKSFFNKSFSVMLAYITPIMYGIDTKQGAFFETNKYKDSRGVNITDLLKNIAIIELTYRFNKGKTVKKKEKDIEIINEKSSKGLM